jgi:methylphosphotriester-DNA--protein-cysteine methyltransferase
MFHHIELSSRKLKSLIDEGEIAFGGNKQLKIYGMLSCDSGKRMKKENRVFFTSAKKALNEGYRPCGHCMKAEYKKWKARK